MKPQEQVWPFCQGVQILACRFGLASNREELLPLLPGPIEVASLCTDFHEVLPISWPQEEADAYIFIADDPFSEPEYQTEGASWFFRGPFVQLSQQASDRRFSFWGNQGFLYRLTLRELEKNHGIYSFHACGLVDEVNNRLYLVVGGAGSGKTVYLLSGLSRGLRLFSTETVHFKLEAGEINWFMGSLIDNIRLGTLRHDFPSFLPPELRREEDLSKEWQKKVALDLSAYRYSSSTLISPGCVLIFPRIEQGREGFKAWRVEDRRKAARLLFTNLTEKIAPSFVLYDLLAIPGFDSPELAAERLKAVYNLLAHPEVQPPLEVLSNPRDCWGDILNKNIKF